MRKPVGLRASRRRRAAILWSRTSVGSSSLSDGVGGGCRRGLGLGAACPAQGGQAASDQDGGGMVRSLRHAQNVRLWSSGRMKDAGTKCTQPMCTKSCIRFTIPRCVVNLVMNSSVPNILFARMWAAFKKTLPLIVLSYFVIGPAKVYMLLERL